MKRILYLFLVFLLVACQNSYDVSSKIESLNNKLKEDNTNENAYIDLFDAYIINGNYFDAIRVIDKSLKYSKGTKTKQLIDKLKNGYDVYEKDNNIHKRVLVDYDMNFDPFYKDTRNIDSYLGKGPSLGNFDNTSDISKYLTSNNQKLYKKSNYTVYLLNDNDVITDIYQYVYNTTGKRFENIEENHYKVEYDGDYTFYICDNGLTECYENEKIIKSSFVNDRNNIEVTFNYDNHNNLTKVVKRDNNDTITTEYERYDDGSPHIIKRYCDLKEIKEFNIGARKIKDYYEYTKDGRMLTRKEYFNDELSYIDEFKYDSNNRLIFWKSTNDDPIYDFAYTYTYNNDGYLIRKDSLTIEGYQEKYIYNEDYSKVAVCGDECEWFELYD